MKYLMTFEKWDTIFEKWDRSFVNTIADEYGFDTKKLKYLGSGAFGSAYRIGKKVLKITSDHDEYMNANKLRRKSPTKYLINYYDARQIDQDGWYFALIMDYVKPIPEYEIPIFNSANRKYENQFDKKYKNREEAKKYIESLVAIPVSFKKEE
jgi:hypothetical protein